MSSTKLPDIKLDNDPEMEKLREERRKYLIRRRVKVNNRDRRYCDFCPDFPDNEPCVYDSGCPYREHEDDLEAGD